jgi:hypothetical protein
MSLDPNKLENVRQRGDKTIARCPACAEAGSDTDGDNLAIWESGAYYCIANPSDNHSKRIFELAGIKEHSGKPCLPRYVAPPAPIKPKTPLRLSGLRKLTVGEMAAIAHLRGWPMFAGLEFLSQRGLLWYGEVYDAGQYWPAWIITDSARRNAQARRLDGQPWQGIGGAKAKTLPGAEASWPIGAPEIGDRPFIVLSEGGPDFLASLFVAWSEGMAIPGFDLERVAPACICGTGHTIPNDALPYFAGKHVRIAIHDDKAGHTAAKLWAEQLYHAGATSVDGFDFAGIERPDRQPVKDLADFAMTIEPDPEKLPEVCALAELPDWITQAGQIACNVAPPLLLI